MKQWKTPVVESHGDYRDEMWLEDYIGGPLYEHQHSIPKLPIPSVEQTLTRLLPTALPLVKTSEEKIALIEACRAFPEQAALLQRRLIERRNDEFANSSWLQQWWNQVRTISYVLC